MTALQHLMTMHVEMMVVNLVIFLLWLVCHRIMYILVTIHTMILGYSTSWSFVSNYCEDPDIFQTSSKTVV